MSLYGTGCTGLIVKHRGCCWWRLKRRALVALHAAMRDGKIEKRYLTLVAGRWPNPVQHVKLPLHKRVHRGGRKTRHGAR